MFLLEFTLWCHLMINCCPIVFCSWNNWSDTMSMSFILSSSCLGFKPSTASSALAAREFKSPLGSTFSGGVRGCTAPKYWGWLGMKYGINKLTWNSPTGNAERSPHWTWYATKTWHEHLHPAMDLGNEFPFHLTPFCCSILMISCIVLCWSLIHALTIKQAGEQGSCQMWCDCFLVQHSVVCTIRHSLCSYWRALAFSSTFGLRDHPS